VRLFVRSARPASALAPPSGLLVRTMAGEAQTCAELECSPDTYLNTEMCDKYSCRVLPDAGAGGC
jgi:hypothetical protein